MTKKDCFITLLQKEVFDKTEILSEKYPDIWNDAYIYWEGLMGDSSNERPLFTDNGKLIMVYLQSLPKESPMLKARDIGEAMSISSRAISGAMRKLVSDGFVEKIGQDPVMYSLTDKGRNITIE